MSAVFGAGGSASPSNSSRNGQPAERRDVGQSAISCWYTRTVSEHLSYERLAGER